MLGFALGLHMGCGFIGYSCEDQVALNATEKKALLEFVRVNGLDSLHPSKYASQTEIDCASPHAISINAGGLGIDSIPPSFSEFKFAHDIHLDHNDLRSLPEEVSALNPIFLSIGWNRLCKVSDGVSHWLDGHDSLWRETQTCD
ncbi:MAG: hypothetical protein ABIW76_01240 [Fibrobacteria bacterium]